MEHDPNPISELDEESQEATSVSAEEERAETGQSGETKKLLALETTFPKVDVTSDERTMAALAHGSAIFTLLTGGFGGLIVAFVIWAVYRDKSRWVANQSLQALVFQLVATVATYVLLSLAGVAFVLSTALMVVLIGFCILPFTLVLGLVGVIFPLVATAYGVFGALETYKGRDFQYWWVGDLVRKKQGN